MCSELASQKGAYGNHGADRLFNELHLRITRPRVRTFANAPYDSQPAVLRAIDRRLRFHKSHRFLRMVVQRSKRGHSPFAQVGGAAGTSLKIYNSAGQSAQSRI